MRSSSTETAAPADSRQGRWSGRKIVVLLPDWAKTYLNNNVGKVLHALEHCGAEITLFCAQGAELSHFQSHFPTAKVEPRRVQGSTLSNLRAFFGVLRGLRPDLIFWTYGGYKENLLLALLRPFGGPKYVIKTDSYLPDETERRSLRNRLADLLFFRMPARNASLVIVESAELRDRARRLYGGALKLHLLPNGVPLERFRAMVQKFRDGSAPMAGPYVLFTGRVMRSKGVDLLIEAFASVADRMPGWKLAVVGPVWEPDFLAYCRHLAETGAAAGRVSFHDFAEGEALYRWYHFAEMFALPSREEGLANRIPEAMYFGNPVLAFDVGQTRSMVDESTGRILPPGDVQGLGRAILELAHDERARKGKAAAARERIESGFDDKSLIAGLLAEVERNVL